jgi:hypothetical protein
VQQLLDAAFRVDGRILAGFAATAKGRSALPFSGTTLRSLAPYLKEYGGTKTSLHFDPAKPLPATLVRKLIKARSLKVERTWPKLLGDCNQVAREG